MKKFHFCFSHLSKEAEGKKRLSLKFSGFSLVSMLEDQEPRSRFITKKAEWLWEREWESLKWTFSLQVLTVKILRLQGGNSIILNLGGKTKILSYVSCFYQKSLAKKKNKPFLRKCLLTILHYVSYCFFPFQSFPQTRALLIFRQRSTCITEIPKGSTPGVFTSSTHYHQKAIFPLKLRRWNLIITALGPVSRSSR